MCMHSNDHPCFRFQVPVAVGFGFGYPVYLSVLNRAPSRLLVAYLKGKMFQEMCCAICLVRLRP